MTVVPSMVDATGETSGDVFASTDRVFTETDWPEKPARKRRIPNPFQEMVDGLYDTNYSALAVGISSQAIGWVAPACDEKIIRGQLRRATGERATAQIKVLPTEDPDMVTVKFRLVPKIRRPRKHPVSAD